MVCQASSVESSISQPVPADDAEVIAREAEVIVARH